MILMRNNSFANKLSDFIVDNGANSIVINIGEKKESMLEAVQAFFKKSQCECIVVNSDITNFNIETLISFLTSLREIIGGQQIILLHPSKVHPEDREAILSSVKEPFSALQGHDYEIHPITDMKPILNDFLS